MAGLAAIALEQHRSSPGPRQAHRSMPRSPQLRTMWVGGSSMVSMMVLSISVPAPSISRAICFPHPTATSRTSRGSLFQTTPMGCMRVFITPSFVALNQEFIDYVLVFHEFPRFTAMPIGRWATRLEPAALNGPARGHAHIRGARAGSQRRVGNPRGGHGTRA